MAPVMRGASPAPRPGSGLPMLALLVGLLILPFAIAGGLFFGGWQPARPSNHGSLLNPPLALPASGLRDASGRPLVSAELHGKWLLVLFGRGPCDHSCGQRIDEMRRVQVSLNKLMLGVQRLVLSDVPADAGLLAWRQRQPDLRLASAAADWLPGLRAGTTYRYAIVDPQGYLVMTYPPDIAATDLRADLERLLKFTWNG